MANLSQNGLNVGNDKTETENINIIYLNVIVTLPH